MILERGSVSDGDKFLAKELLEVAAWLGMRTVDRVSYADYLQRPGVNIDY